MISPNFLVIALAALIPLVIGAIWYNPKVLGNAWMKSTGLSEEQLKGANMPLIFGLTYLFSFMAGLELNTIVVHQLGFQSMMMGEVELFTGGSEANALFTSVIDKYGDAFRTFKHGAFHGTIAGVLFALPIIGIIALFERKGGKYIFIHAGYWILSLALMGGVICQFA